MTKVFSKEDILYVDREYISNQYENIEEVSPHTKITKTEGLNAGIKAPFISAGASSIESKVYEISIMEMLTIIYSHLCRKPDFTSCEHDIGKKSSYAWGNGQMTVMKTTVNRNRYTLTLVGEPKDNQPENKKEIISEEHYFAIKDGNKNKFALITTPDYFTSGISSIIELSGSVAQEIVFPVNALLRILPVRSSFSEWVSIPLLIIENDA